MKKVGCWEVRKRTGREEMEEEEEEMRERKEKEMLIQP